MKNKLILLVIVIALAGIGAFLMQYYPKPETPVATPSDTAMVDSGLVVTKTDTSLSIKDTSKVK